MPQVATLAQGAEVVVVVVGRIVVEMRNGKDYFY